ncbi:NAD(P)-binding domain-containing protein [Nocardiopsis rhodophaea]|uniref:NAD(P)-binding domain-containing protein n=1 Tax=Nocardiopsis rhodophaea TaxID=280238 RepID=UPI0031E369B4
MYFDRDADLADLAGETVAVIGYGVQGRAFAANLRDSGLRVLVGNRDDAYRDAARADGFAPLPIADAVERASAVLLLIPDEAHPEVYDAQIAPHLGDGDLFVLAHGFSVRFGRIRLPIEADAALLAPKMFGRPIRRHYLEGTGVLAFLDVLQDPTGRALRRTLAVAKATGFTRRGVMPVPHAQETELDLFQEQFLTPLLMDGFKMAFDVLVDAGYDPVPALLDMYASGEMAEMMTEAATVGLYEVIAEQGSPTCRFGVQRRLGTLLGDDVEAKARKILGEIRSGAFAAALEEEAGAGYPSLDAYDAMAGASGVTRAHERYRAALDPRPAVGPGRTASD